MYIDSFDQCDSIAQQCIDRGVPIASQLVVQVVFTTDDLDDLASLRRSHRQLHSELPGSRSAGVQHSLRNLGEADFCTCDLEYSKSAFDLHRERSCRQAQQAWLQVTEHHNELVNKAKQESRGIDQKMPSYLEPYFETVAPKTRVLEADLTMCYANLGRWQDRLAEPLRRTRSTAIP
eukprot:s5121_g7.t1